MRLGTLYTQASELCNKHREEPTCVVTPYAWYQELQVVGFHIHHTSQQVVLAVDEVPTGLRGLAAETIRTLAHQNARYFGYTVHMAKPMDPPQPIVAITAFPKSATSRPSTWSFRTDIGTTGTVTIEDGRFVLAVEAKLPWAMVEHLYEWASYKEDMDDDAYAEITAIKDAMKAAVGWMPTGGTGELTTN